MDRKLQAAVEALVGRESGQPAHVRATQAAGGGCINNACMVEMDDGRRYFVKSNPAPLPGMFSSEAKGLAALAAADAIRVPAPLGTGEGEDGVTPFIVMEYIETGSQGAGFHERFGEQLARLHQAATAQRHGFDHDNYIGSTTQPNGWHEDWVVFWRERRLGHQLALARENGLADAAMLRAGEALTDRLESVIGTPEEPACLLHGDLWGGNYLCDQEGRAVLIDPATYYGRREADLAMTMLFGGFPSRFFDAYQAVWPLAPGAEERLEIYKLYHLLNHLNLFGGSYYSSCMNILRRYGG